MSIPTEVGYVRPLLADMPECLTPPNVILRTTCFWTPCERCGLYHLVQPGPPVWFTHKDGTEDKVEDGLLQATAFYTAIGRN